MKASKGEVMFYNKIKGRPVTAINGKSSAGEGWRPVCAGHYLGNQCFDAKDDAINYGIKVVEQLKARAESKKKINSKKQESV